jgi:prepilin peptidase CpaA
MTLPFSEAFISGGMALVLGAVLLTVAIGDARKFRIPNATVIFLTILYFLAAWLGVPGTVGWIAHLGAGLLVLAIGYFLFAFRVFGGGDAKLMAALALWTGFADLSRFALLTALFGGVLALALLVMRRMSWREGSRFAHLLAKDAPIPYGIAIVAAAFDWIYLRLIVFPH